MSAILYFGISSPQQGFTLTEDAEDGSTKDGLIALAGII